MFNPTRIPKRKPHSASISSFSFCATSTAQNNARTLGNKSYEVSNHLGNVMAVVSDRKTPIPETTNTTKAFNETDIKAYNDYYPYGMVLQNRSQSLSEAHRFGFQGQEKDDEVKGKNNSINYKYRVHDPRVGRFFAVDPLASIYPYNSTYAFSENNVIQAVELEGLEKYVVHYYYEGSIAVKLKVLVYAEKEYTYPINWKLEGEKSKTDYSKYRVLEIHHNTDGTTSLNPKQDLSKDESEALKLKPTIKARIDSPGKLSLRGEDDETLKSRENVEANSVAGLVFYRFEKVLFKHIGGFASGGYTSDDEIIENIQSAGFSGEFDMVRIFVKKELRDRVLEKLKSFDIDVDDINIIWADKPTIEGKDIEFDLYDEK